jgi:hypothetical protein
MQYSFEMYAYYTTPTQVLVQLNIKYETISEWILST